MCLSVTLPARGGLFLNPKLRQQLLLLQSPSGSAVPCGMPRLRPCPVHPSAVSGTAEARHGAAVGGEAPLRVVPFSPCLGGFLCQAVFPRTCAPAKVTAGLGAAGGRALEIERFLHRERLPKANNRGCRPLSLPAANSCQRWRQLGTPRGCGSSSGLTGGRAAPTAQTQPQSGSSPRPGGAGPARAPSPGPRCLPSACGCVVSVIPGDAVKLTGPFSPPLQQTAAPGSE